MKTIRKNEIELLKIKRNLVVSNKKCFDKLIINSTRTRKKISEVEVILKIYEDRSTEIIQTETQREKGDSREGLSR